MIECMILFLIFQEAGISGNVDFDMWELKYEKITPQGINKIWGQRYFTNINLFPYLYFVQGDFEIRYINSPLEVQQVYGKNFEKVFRKNIKIDKEPLKLEFFDIYKNFGRNLFAGFTKDETILLERFLKGFSGNLKIGIFDFGFTYGRPYEYIYYSQNTALLKDTLDEFKISEAKVNLLPGINLGGYHVFYDQHILFEPEKKRAEFTGFTIDLKGGILTIYEEYSKRKGVDKLIWTDTLPYDLSKGFANYSQIIFSIKKFTISGEYEKYKKYSSPYALPPCIHPYGISLSQGRDEEGYALNFLFPLFFLDFDINLSKSFYRKDKKIEEQRINLRAERSPLLFDLTLDNSYLLGAEIKEGFDPVKKRKEKDFKTKIQYSFPLITLSFGTQFRRREDTIYDTLYKYTEPLYEFEILHPFGFLNITYSQDKDKKNYYSFETMFQIGYNLELSLFYGKERGEIKCSGGICRYEPPFEGFKTKISYSF